MSKFTVTIGIPAFNEEMNISLLLQDLAKQKTSKVRIKKIIIYSDGSTDQTVKKARSVKTLPVALIASRKRCGVAHAQNTIMKKADSDILILLNADIRIEDRYFIEKITRPLLSQKADLVSVPLRQVETKTFIERMLAVSMEMKEEIFLMKENGNNVFTCHGPARALSKRLYQLMTFPTSVGEDAYSFLFTQATGFTYRYVRTTHVFYQLPRTFSDHKTQSIRYFQCQKLLSHYFERDFVASSYKLSKIQALPIVIRTFVKHPFYLGVYIGIALWMKFTSLWTLESDFWQIAKSSKIVRRSL